ncbi:MAG TPA: ComEC/Rec2 family competence protein [Candidatus Paceibacterota bacterium]
MSTSLSSSLPRFVSHSPIFVSNARFFLCTSGFFAGVAFYSVHPFGLSFSFLCICLALIALVLRSVFSIPLFILLLSFSVGTVRMGFADISTPRSSDFSTYFGRQILIEGDIVSDPERRGTTLRAVLEVSSLDGQECEGVRILGIFDAASRLSYGDRLSLRGILQTPEAFETDNGRVFEYEKYLRKDGIIAILRNPTLLEREEAPLSLRGSLFSLKNLFKKNLEQMFPEPQAGLLKGMLLGERDALPSDLTDSFIRAGLIHIVVLSGYNVSLVAETLMKVFSFLPRAGNLLVGSVSVILFVVMVGAPATAVRAGIMALLIVLARALRRPQALLRGLLLAGMGMVLWNPFILVFDPSFQLSFLATLGLILFGPLFEARLLFIPERMALRGIAAATLATQVMVLPALLYMSGIFSVFSLPANILALVAVPASMLFGFMGAIFAPFFFLAIIPSAVATAFLSYILFVADFTAALPGSSFVVRDMPLAVVFLLYIFIAGAFYLVKRKDATKAWPSPRSRVQPI